VLSKQHNPMDTRTEVGASGRDRRRDRSVGYTRCDRRYGRRLVGRTYPTSLL
jgi:hypothetical protein